MKSGGLQPPGGTTGIAHVKYSRRSQVLQSKIKAVRSQMAKFSKVVRALLKASRQANVVKKRDPRTGITTVLLKFHPRAKMTRRQRARFDAFKKRAETFGFKFRLVGNRYHLTYFMKGNRVSPQKSLLGGPGFKAAAGSQLHARIPKNLKGAFKSVLGNKRWFGMGAALKYPGMTPAKLAAQTAILEYRMMTKGEVAQLNSAARKAKDQIAGLRRAIKKAKEEQRINALGVPPSQHEKAMAEKDEMRYKAWLKIAEATVALYNYDAVNGGLWVQR